MGLDPSGGRMGATEHTPRDPFRVLETVHRLAEIVERGAVVLGKTTLRFNYVRTMH